MIDEDDDEILFSQSSVSWKINTISQQPTRRPDINGVTLTLT